MTKGVLLFLIFLVGCFASTFPVDYEILERINKEGSAPINVAVNTNLKDALPFEKGYAKVDDKLLSAVYWVMFPSRKASATNVTNYPIIIWLGGGPGISSWVGALAEIGPNKLEMNAGTLTEQPRAISWNDNYTLLFIDQPVGTGYSHVEKPEDMPTTLAAATQQLYHALTLIFTDAKIQKYQKTPIYIFGEDYAGHFVPAIAKFILDQNQKKDVQVKFNLKGIGLSAPLTEPANQISEYGLWGYTLGLLDETERREVELIQLQALKKLRNNDFGGALDIVDQAGYMIREYSGQASLFNYRQFTEPQEFAFIQAYMDDDKTKGKYGEEFKVKFQVFGKDVRKALKNEILTSAADALIAVLGQIPVLIYTGQDDMAMNVACVHNFVSKLRWSKQKDFNNAKFSTWIKQKTHYGLAKTIDKLTFAIVNKAGRLIPLDQPDAALDLVNRFIAQRNDWDDGSLKQPAPKVIKAEI